MSLPSLVEQIERAAHNAADPERAYRDRVKVRTTTLRQFDSPKWRETVDQRWINSKLKIAFEALPPDGRWISLSKAHQRCQGLPDRALFRRVLARLVKRGDVLKEGSGAEAMYRIKRCAP